jgi:hypothetical protein
MGKSENPLDRIAVLSIASYMRDFMTFEMFENLGPLGASERFFTFRHRDCTPGQSTVRGNRTDNIDQVIGGYWNVLPILSNVVVGQLKEQLQAREEIATHAHNLLRASNILADLEKPPFPASLFAPINPFLRFHQAVLRDHPYILKDTVRGFRSFTLHDLTQGMSDGLHFESTDVCERSLQCLVGEVPGGGRAEVILSGERVKYAVLCMPLIYQPILNSDYEGSDEEAGEYIDNLALTIRLFVNFLGAGGDVSTDATNEKGDEILALAVHMRSQILQCGFFTHISRREHEIVEVTTMGAGNWVRFKIFSATHNIAEFP